MEMQSGLWTRAPKEARVTRGAHWRHLANTIDHWTVHVRRRCGLFVKLLWPIVLITPHRSAS